MNDPFATEEYFCRFCELTLPSPQALKRHEEGAHQPQVDKRSAEFAKYRARRELYPYITDTLYSRAADEWVKGE